MLAALCCQGECLRDWHRQAQRDYRQVRQHCRQLGQQPALGCCRHSRTLPAVHQRRGSRSLHPTTDPTTKLQLLAAPQPITADPPEDRPLLFTPLTDRPLRTDLLAACRRCIPFHPNLLSLLLSEAGSRDAVTPERSESEQRERVEPVELDRKCGRLRRRQRRGGSGGGGPAPMLRIDCLHCLESHLSAPSHRPTNPVRFWPRREAGAQLVPLMPPNNQLSPQRRCMTTTWLACTPRWKSSRHTQQQQQQQQQQQTHPYKYAMGTTQADST